MEGRSTPSSIVIMEMLSDRYGWTPGQIREQRVEDIEQYVRILNIKSRLERKHRRKL